jgi:hypothetical protein
MGLHAIVQLRQRGAHAWQQRFSRASMQDSIDGARSSRRVGQETSK